MRTSSCSTHCLSQLIQDSPGFALIKTQRREVVKEFRQLSRSHTNCQQPFQAHRGNIVAQLPKSVCKGMTLQHPGIPRVLLQAEFLASFRMETGCKPALPEHCLIGGHHRRWIERLNHETADGRRWTQIRFRNQERCAEAGFHLTGEAVPCRQPLASAFIGVYLRFNCRIWDKRSWDGWHGQPARAVGLAARRHGERAPNHHPHSFCAGSLCPFERQVAARNGQVARATHRFPSRNFVFRPESSTHWTVRCRR